MLWEEDNKDFLLLFEHLFKRLRVEQLQNTEIK